MQVLLTHLQIMYTSCRNRQTSDFRVLSIHVRNSKIIFSIVINPLRANPTNWSNTLKQFVGNLPTNCLSVFDHLLKLSLKGLNRGCLIYMFSLRFSGSKFLINYSSNFVHVKFFCVSKIFRTQVFAEFAVFPFCV